MTAHKISLTRNKYALVSSEDFASIAQYRWWYLEVGYAATRINGAYVYMHRHIIGAVKGQEVDHINGDRLDNRRENLRISTRSQNNANRQHGSRGASGYRGVCFDKQTGKWRAAIQVHGRSIKLGRHTDKIDAAKAYDEAAVKYFGEFARPNFPK